MFLFLSIEFEDWTVIFMYEHGMIESQGKFWEHNKNAFYSCNVELFGEETPHITDFYDRILEITDSNLQDTQGVDI